MAITFPSLAQAKHTVSGFFQTLLGGWDLSSKGAFGKLKAAVTLTVYSFLSTARQIDRDAVPTSLTSTEGLDEWAENGTGIPNGAGSYGRKVAVAATGGIGSFTGTAGVIYPISTTLTGPDGVTKFVLTAAVTVGLGGNIDGNINATTAGEAGNLEAGTTLTVDSVPIGGNASVVLGTGLTGGAEKESNADVLERIQNRLRLPLKGGVANDYKVWVEDEAGVDGIAAHVYPRRAGTGSTDIVCTYKAQSGQARRVSNGDLATIQAYLDSVRPCGEEHATAMAPYMPNGNGVAIKVRPLESTADNAFEVDLSTGGPFTVSAYNAATPAVTLSANSTGLDTAVNTNGLTPRIQCIATGAALPQEAVVIDYNNATHVATLAAPFVTAPTVGDALYAGGPMVQPIAKAILAHVDGLGPSRSSGFADPDVEWDDTLRIDQIVRVALDATDDNGDRVAVDLDALPTINGVSTNVTATDDGIQSPGAIYAASIAVIP